MEYETIVKVSETFPFLSSNANVVCISHVKTKSGASTIYCLVVLLKSLSNYSPDYYLLAA